MRTCFRTLLLLSFSAALSSGALTCSSSAVPTLVNAEGLTERMGDIILSCSGGTAGQSVTGNLTVFLAVNLTNRTTSDNRTDVTLTIDNGSSLAPVAGTVASSNGVAFNGLSFVLSPAGGATLRIANLRGAVAQIAPTNMGPLTAWIAFNGPLPINNTSLTVGLVNRGLLSVSSSSSIYCVGSPAAASLSFSAFLTAGTNFHSTRFTEGHPSAFQKRTAGADHGTRLMARYSGFPAGARLFVPDFVAGSNSAQPTAGGDLGGTASGGAYTGGSGALLLALIRLTDSNGAGGVPAGPAPAVLDSVSEAPLQGGSGVVVYEVVESNPSQLESAQFPAFVVYTPPEGGSSAVARQEVSIAPLSTVVTTSTQAPVPRYAFVVPPSDCAALGDCNSSYLPRLAVVSEPLNFRAIAGSGFQVRYVSVRNEGGGILTWTVSWKYLSGADWLRVLPTSGRNNGSVRVDVLPEKLTPGTYEADLTIDAGPLIGSRTTRIRLEVTQPPQPIPQPPAIQRAVNAATFEAGAFVPGSIVTLFGARFSGRDVSVTFDGIGARVLYSRDDQINLVAPAELRGRNSALVIVRVDGVSSAPFAVSLTSIAPGIFGVLNQDYSINSAGNGAPAGTVLQVFATGLPEDAPGTILARVHDLEPAAPIYAGPAPGFPGVQQVNVLAPDFLPAMTTDVRVCAYPPERPSERICSPPAKITLR